jgi:hypothetical protein
MNVKLTARPLTKAAKPQMAVYDADGNLVGTVDPDVITELANAKAPEAKPKPAAAPTAAAPAPTMDEQVQKLRKAMGAAHSAPEREQIATVLNQAAIIKLATIRMQAGRGL